MKISVWILAVLSIFVVLLVSVFKVTPLSFFTVNGNSMDPYFSNGDVGVLVEKETLERNHIVFFPRPDSWKKEDERILVKRAVAVAGDELRYDSSGFSVNGKLIFDNSNFHCERVEHFSGIVPEGWFLAFGDNLRNSIDSRTRFCSGEDDYLVSTKSVIRQGTVLFHL